MDNETFNEILKTRQAKMTAVLVAKADEYARGDRLSNFKKAAVLMSCTPEAALFGMVAKHIVAITDFCDDLANDTIQPYVRWDEKLGDIINYMVLLDALIIERLHSVLPTNPLTIGGARFKE